jgi:hypothetical protein
LVGSDIKIAHLVSRHSSRSTLSTNLDHFWHKLVIFDGSSGVSNVEVLFLKSVEVINFASNLAILNDSIRSLNHAEVVDSSIGSETEDETDVWTFWSLNGTKTTVVRRVDVTHLIAGASTVKTTGTKGGNSSQVLEFLKSIGLLHELGELVGGEELLDTSLKGFRRDELDWQSDICVDGRHPVLDVSLNLGHTDTNLLLEEFSDETDATRAEVVNVIWLRTWSDIEVDNMTNN